MIQATSFPINLAHAEKISRQPVPANLFGNGAHINATDRVSLSAEGRAMQQAVSAAVNQGAASSAPTNGELPALPAWFANYGELTHRAELGLKEALRQLAIPPGTKLSIRSEMDGTLTVQGAGSRNAELEALVNNNQDLRNALVGAENAAYLSRIGAATEKAYGAIDANPAKADYYNQWLISVTQRIMHMGFEFSFAEGALTGAFLSDGRKIGLTEQMETLPA